MHSGLELFLRYQSLRSWESDLSQGNLMSHNGNPTMLNGIGLYGYFAPSTWRAPTSSVTLRRNSSWASIQATWRGFHLSGETART
jgi:hypothetical protein